jgi:hypothetical protein
MTKKRHDFVVTAYNDRIDAAVRAIDREYARATRDGKAKVHDWAREATWNVFHGGQAQAAFQEAERIFRPDPNPIKEEVLEDAAVRS